MNTSSGVLVASTRQMQPSTFMAKREGNLVQLEIL